MVSSPFVDHAALSTVTVFVFYAYFNVLLICLQNYMNMNVNIWFPISMLRT